jgi:two-component system, NarL family, nitrate/nitrite response regulator NarL
VTVLPMDDARILLQRLVAWLATVDDVRLLGTADTLLDLLETSAGSADVFVLDAQQADWDGSPAALRQQASAGRRVIVFSVIAPPGTASDSPSPPVGAEAARPHLAPQERAVLLAYASGMTLVAAARRAGVRPATAKVYLERVKEKYRQAGRPTYTKLDLAARVHEDGLSLGQD